MKLGPILAALGGAGAGLAAGGGMGGLAGLSPVLAMLLQNKKKKKGQEAANPNAALAEAGKTAVNRPAITPQAPIAPAAYGPGTMPAILQGGMTMGGKAPSTGFMPPPPTGLFGR
jgi:hypothetical protein